MTPASGHVWILDAMEAGGWDGVLAPVVTMGSGNKCGLTSHLGAC